MGFLIPLYVGEKEMPGIALFEKQSVFTFYILEMLFKS